MSANDAQAQLAQMLNKPLYVALSEPKDLNRMHELLSAHLAWAVGSERRGEIFASGPFVAEGCPPGTQGGMTIVRAGSYEEAHRILSFDPFVKEGVVTFTLRKWILMEGGFSVTVRFSDQSSRLS